MPKENDLQNSFLRKYFQCLNMRYCYFFKIFIKKFNIKLMLTKGAENLPPKVAHDYKALAKLYDAKNYKKGLKNTDKILQLHPDHPETLSMKALFESALGQNDKAEQTAKAALLKSKMLSMFCWHTYGTILKLKKDYIEAAKCFQNALKFEKDNLQILRETALLQIQVRDHFNHVETRLSILKQKANLISNWVAFTVALHLKGDFDQLYKALGSLENIRMASELKPVQLSHYYLYRTIAFRDGGKYEKQYQELKKYKDKILDEEVWWIEMLNCCKKLNKLEEAKDCLESLLKKFPQNLEYISQYKEMTKMEGQQYYRYLNTEYKSKISKIYELCVISDDAEFKTAFVNFIKPYYKKNLISLFAEIQVVYEGGKEKNIEEVFLEFEESLTKMAYPDGEEAVSPSEYLWSLYLLAQHYSRNFETLKKAYDYINKAIEHTNTVSEFYMTKSDIEFKMHNLIESLKTVNVARKTDLADRYMNNLCVKFLMRCRKPALGEDMLRMFMRDEASLYELQNHWYIIEAGKSFLLLRNFESGLRHLNFIEKQFKDMEANQYDFHTYCIRKWTLKEYVQYIEFNDNIFKDKKYAQSAAEAMKYLWQYTHHLLNPPKVQEKEPEKETEEKEKKKKKKKKKNKVEEEELSPMEAFRKKIDYYGKDYAEKIKEDPMKEALNYAKNVASIIYTNKNNKEENKYFSNAFSEAIKVFIFFKKPLLVIKCLKKLIKTNYCQFTCTSSKIQAAIYLEKVLEEEKTDILIKEAVKEFLGEIKEAKTLQEWSKALIEALPETLETKFKKMEIDLLMSEKNSRNEFISLYQEELLKLIKENKNDLESLQRVFYLVHKLEFYGEMKPEYTEQLNKIYSEETTYFTDWFNEIDQLPLTTWSPWWLSDYDQKREQELMKEEKKEEKKQEKKQDQKKEQTKEEAKK